MASGSTTSQILTIRRIFEGVRTKNLQATILFDDFTKASDSIRRRRMEQILFAYGLPKETVAAVMILYRNNKVKVCSPDGDTDYLDIVAGVLQEDTIAPYLFIINLDYELKTSTDKKKKKRFQANKGKKHKIPRKNNFRSRLCRWERFWQIYPPKQKLSYIVKNIFPHLAKTLWSRINSCYCILFSDLKQKRTALLLVVELWAFTWVPLILRHPICLRSDSVDTESTPLKWKSLITLTYIYIYIYIYTYILETQNTSIL